MTNKIASELFEAYLNEARTWETDKVRAIEKSKKVAWRIAIASGCLAFASVLAVAMLSPLKTTEPFVIRVDNSTGIVDVVTALKDGKTTYDEAMSKYFTQWYVRYREGFSMELAEEYYKSVGIMSVGLEQQKYFELFNPKNPLSPINIYGPSAKSIITIKSTSFLKPNVAMVRYTKGIQRGLSAPELTHWAATITFKYSGAPMKENDRAINPLGFQVVEYRNDPDAFTPATTVPAKQAEVAAPSPAGVTVFAGQATPSVPPAVAAVPRAQAAP